MAKEKGTQASCPFWSSSSLKCRICRGGLFIPLDDHIETYCKTRAYPQCLQYSLHAENQIELTDSTKILNHNRRKFERVESNYEVTLVRLIGSDKIVSHTAAVAKTLDLSLGGMRLATKHPLINDSLIEFAFDETFPKNIGTCTGQVAWCNKQIDEPGYQAGIIFQEKHIAQAVGTHLNLPGTH